MDNTERLILKFLKKKEKLKFFIQMSILENQIENLK